MGKTKIDIENAYLRPYYEKYWSSIKDHLKDLSLRTDAIRPYFPKNFSGNILDFGCGSGEILEEIATSNPKAKITGIDVSETALKLAKKRIPNATFKTIVESKKIPIESESIDYILSNDVIEHIYDTEWMFNEFSRTLKKDGLILISTPYCGLIKNLVITLTNFELVYNPLGPHIRFYTRKSLERCLDQIGFRTIRFGTFGRFYPLSKGMFVLAKKRNGGLMRFEEYCV